MSMVWSVLRNTRFYICRTITCTAALSAFLLIPFLAPNAALAQTPVITQHNNNARTGVYPTETTLTPANVNQSTFGKLFAYPVDGRIYAQPLYVPGVTIPGKGTHNVVYIETEHDSVYAFDADSNGGANATPLWQITLLDAAHGAASGATTVPNTDVSSTDIVPEIGITSTPVIDLATGTMYLHGKTKEGTPSSPTYVQRLHALDITTGAEKFGGPTTISASVPGTGNGSSGGTLNFDPKWENQRPGLLEQNGVIYIAFGSHGDNGPWHGWVLSYNASTLKFISAFCTTSNGSGSGIWMAGGGIAGDVVDPVNKPYGRMFIATGNGSFNATAPYTNAMNYGDDIVNLDLTGGNITVQDHFTPSNQASLNSGDLDVSSGGVLLLPDQPSGVTHLLVQAGKEGKIYLINRDSMGGFNASSDNIIEEIPNQSGGLWSIPAFWNNNLYTWGRSSNLMSFAFSGGTLNPAPTASAFGSGFPGASPSISSNGNANAILWAARTDAYNTSGNTILYAFDATNMANELYDSTQNPARDTAGLANKFAFPTIANGKVYLSTGSELDVYGLLGGNPTAAAPVISPGSESFSGTLSVTITDSTPGAIIYYTTDGSTPTTSSAQYAGPISVATTETITAIASATGYVQSAVSTQTYTLLNQVLTPTFTPPSASFSTPLSVSMSDATSGASIYYTLDGSTPTTSSTKYTAPITLSTTTTVKAIGAASGMFNSNVGSAVYTYVASSGGTGSDFANGFSSATSYMTLNGSTGLADSRLQLTNGGQNEAGSAWFNTPLNIQSFTNDFTFQIANPQADGFTFTIQNVGLTALGSTGGSLGYGVGGQSSIGNSVAIKFDIYDNSGEGPNSTGLYTDGASPTVPAVNLTGTGIDLHSGDTFSVHMVYNGTTLTMTITDGVTSATYTTSWTVNIPQVVGANTAYVGFTGGAGGLSSSQKIETWTFSPTSGGSGPQAATPTFSPAGGTYLGTQTVTLSDATSGATILYTTNGSTPATTPGGSTLQYSGPLTISASETINAIAVASGYSSSNVATAAYTIESQVAAPTFSPAAGSYSSSQSVSISTTTSGASIYYTLDGSTPNTTAGGSTVLYSAPINIGVSTTVKAIAAKSGYFASNVSSAAYTISGSPNTINFGSGFAAGGMVMNGSAALNGTRLRLTNGGTYQAGTAWYGSTVNINSFTTNFSFQITPGTSTLADGFTFIIQSNGTTALGPVGGGLGYGADTAGSTNPASILNSVAIKFDLYSNSGETPDSTGLYTNGASPTTPYVDMTSSGVNIHSGDVFNVAISYNGTNLTMTITDATTAATFTNTWPINIASTVGSSSAYVGFGAGTGGFTAIQDIISWTFNSGSSTPTAATPAFSPAAGTYTSAQSVTISDTTSGATIYYTTDGSTPTTSSAKYTGAISVPSNMTLNAIAVASGYNNSAVGTAAYSIQPPAATPIFSPAAGTYSSTQSVTISDTTSGATVYYTTDGSTPTTSSTKYTAPVSVPSNMTINAIATASGFSTSAVGSAAYIIQIPTAATPTFSPAAGTYATAQSVTISDTTSGATIYYTTNGTTPTTGSTKYTGAISVSASETINAIAVASGFNNSAVGSAAYVIQTAAATPTFSPAGGTYSSAQSVTISDTTTGATIYYTTNGTTPTTSSPKYTGAISVAASETINAIAVASGFTNSAVGSAAYVIQTAAAPPTFSPAGGTYSSAQSVTISDTTTGATIYYTTNGTTPTTSSTKYTGAIAVSSTTTINAIAVASGFSNSAVASATYTIGTPTNISFGNGFATSTGLQFNGGAALNGTHLRLTDGGSNEARSAFWTSAVNTQSFATDFTFIQTPGAGPGGDGFAFVLQNVGATALGPSGGGLGYGPGFSNGTGGIANSIAIKFDLYDNTGEGPNSTGLYTNGASPTTPALDMTSSGVNLHSMDVMRAHITYDGTTLVLVVSDTQTGATFTNSWPINIPSTIGSTTALAGFTGGTGGYTETQDIITWTYKSGAPGAVVSDATSGLTATTSGATLSSLSYSGFPDGTGTILNATGTGQSVTFTVNVPAAATYDIAYTTQVATNHGNTQFAINGTNVGPAPSQYASATGYARFDLGNYTFPSAGAYSFTFTVNGKNSNSTGYALAFDDLILTPQ